MKIALIIERFEPSRGGREHSTAQMAAELARRGHEVSIICQTACWEQEGVEICQVGRKGWRRVRRLGNFVADVQKEIKRENWDVVHSTLPLPGANVYQPRGGTIPGQMASRGRRLSTMGRLSQRLGGPSRATRRAMQRMEQQLAENPKVLWLAISELVAKEFEQYYPIKTNVRIIYNGVDVPEIEPGQRNEWRKQTREELGGGADDLVLLSVANNFALKGVGETIRGFGKWQSKGSANRAKLVIVGRGAAKKYQRLAKREGLEGRVFFAGASEQVWRWYAAADACVLLSWYDPCSRVILEALSWGIACITTAYNGAGEVLGDGGIVVSSPDDSRAVVNAMEQVGDRQRRAKMAQACLERAGQVSMQRHVDQLLEAYGEVLRTTRQPVG